MRTLLQKIKEENMQGALKGWYWVSETVGQASTLFGPFWKKGKIHNIAAGILGACGAVYQGVTTAKFSLPKWGGEAEEDASSIDADKEMGSTIDSTPTNTSQLKHPNRNKGRATSLKMLPNNSV